MNQSPGRGGGIGLSIQGSGFEMNGKGASARPTLKVSNLHGMVTGMAEDLQSLVSKTWSGVRFTPVFWMR